MLLNLKRRPRLTQGYTADDDDDDDDNNYIIRLIPFVKMG
jgi:hypothetical protein